MRVRHLTAQGNVDGEGWLLDPAAVRHGLLVAGRVAQLAGPVDLDSHAARGVLDHGLDDCIVVERLEVGAAVLTNDEGFVSAALHPARYAERPAVDLAARRTAWIQTLRERRGAP